MSSQKFILVEGVSNKIPEFLVQEVREFSDSGEYLCLDDEDKKSPYVVCGAFSNYISRMYAEGNNTDSILDKAFNAIESLSSIEDIEVQNLVVVGILECIHFDQNPELIHKLGIKSKVLYEYWLT